MTCKSCVEKWINYYEEKGFKPKQAVAMAKKLVDRVEKRLGTKRKTRIIRFFEIWLRWVLLTNWIATIRWRRWIGLSWNPDYTQACNCAAGNCNPETACGAPLTCRTCLSPTCPSALPNSSYTSNTCSACTMASGCTCILEICGGSPGTCSATGACNYTCDSGFFWNGSACVPATLIVVKDP